MAQVWNSLGTNGSATFNASFLNTAGGIASSVAGSAKNVASSAWYNTQNYATKAWNSYTNWANNVTPGNMANAAITGVLGIIGTIGTIAAGSRVQKLYKQQEAQYISNAMEQARTMQLKGDIELRNLRYKHAMQQGLDELAVAAGASGNLSGSFLDKLVANKRYEDADQRSQELSTLWAVSETKRQGYIQALATAGQAELQAVNSRGKFFESGVNGIMRAANSLLQDSIAQKRINAMKDQIDYQIMKERAYLDSFYYNPLKINNPNSVRFSGDDSSYDYDLLKLNYDSNQIA